MPPKTAQKGGSSTAPPIKGKPFKAITKTADLIRNNDNAKRRGGKTKERLVLGGLQDLIKTSENLPGAVQVERFAEARAMEILALQNAMKLAASQSNSRAFQSLPRHLRRRAASHNPRRVPKRMRKRAAAEIDPGDLTVRVHRKKAKLLARGNLRGQLRTAQLLMRQRDKNWLETHLFHAKRFHMKNLWGYRLAQSPTLKSFRSSYRAARRKVTLQDTSYFGTVEIRGTMDELVTVLGRVTDGAFAGGIHENGSRAAEVNMYHLDKFPYGLIGPVQVLWMPPGTTSINKRLVWVRTHPSITQEVEGALRDAAMVVASSSSRSRPAMEIRNMKGNLGSFELMGPLAGRTIMRALALCNIESHSKRKAIGDLLHLDPSEIPEGVVLGLHVNDPRLSFPPVHLQQSQPGTRSALEILHSIPVEEMTRTLIWDEKALRSCRRTTKKSDLDDRRNKIGLPGTRLQPTGTDPRVPILLVKRTIKAPTNGESASAFHGWTLILPDTWAMAILPSFVYCGVKLIALDQRVVQYREAGTVSFPEHYGQVCPAGEKWEAEQSYEDERLWLRKPPGKRPEYSALNTQFPFKPDWDAVLSFGDGQASRPWLFSSVLAPFLSKLSLTPAGDERETKLLDMVNTLRRRREMGALEDHRRRDVFAAGVIQVSLRMIGRGSPSDMAMLFDTSADERRRWLEAYRADNEAGGRVAEWNALQQQTSAMQTMSESVSPSRIIGFVNTGNISLSRGAGHGLATMSLKAYLELMDIARAECGPWANTLLVQTRNRDGRIYRLAAVEVI